MKENQSMFQISKPWLSKIKAPEQYFAYWIEWFNSRGIKTEIRKNSYGYSLWREGTEIREWNREKERKTKRRVKYETV